MDVTVKDYGWAEITKMNSQLWKSRTLATRSGRILTFHNHESCKQKWLCVKLFSDPSVRLLLLKEGCICWVLNINYWVWLQCLGSKIRSSIIIYKPQKLKPLRDCKLELQKAYFLLLFLVPLYCAFILSRTLYIPTSTNVRLLQKPSK